MAPIIALLKLPKSFKNLLSLCTILVLPTLLSAEEASKFVAAPTQAESGWLLPADSDDSVTGRLSDEIVLGLFDWKGQKFEFLVATPEAFKDVEEAIKAELLAGQDSGFSQIVRLLNTPIVRYLNEMYSDKLRRFESAYKELPLDEVAVERDQEYVTTHFDLKTRNAALSACIEMKVRDVSSLSGDEYILAGAVCCDQFASSKKTDEGTPVLEPTILFLTGPSFEALQSLLEEVQAVDLQKLNESSQELLSVEFA